jgi:hypothetical protein
MTSGTFKWFLPWFLLAWIITIIPIFLHPSVPGVDTPNHLARLQVLATLHERPALQDFYKINFVIFQKGYEGDGLPPTSHSMQQGAAASISGVGIFGLRLRRRRRRRGLSFFFVVRWCLFLVLQNITTLQENTSSACGCSAEEEELDEDEFDSDLSCDDVTKTTF